MRQRCPNERPHRQPRSSRNHGRMPLPPPQHTVAVHAVVVGTGLAFAAEQAEVAVALAASTSTTSRGGG